MGIENEKIKNYKSKFKFNEKNLDYVVQLKKRNRKWLWLLLLLLPLLLFIKCSKDVTIQTLDENGNICPHTKVSFAHTARFLYDNKSFFADEPYHAIQTTDTNGITIFKDLRYSIFSSIFFINSKAFISARSECFAKDITLLFHFIRSKKPVQIKMNAIRTDVQLKVVDARLKSPLKDAVVHYEYIEYGELYRDSVKSDMNGYVIIPNIPKCHVLDLIQTSIIDYVPDVRKNVSVNELLNDEKKSIIPLDPIDKCRGIWIVKLKGRIDRREYECILRESNKATIIPSQGLFDETYQCNGEKLIIRWKLHSGSGCTWKLTGTINGDTYNGTFEHIDTKNGNLVYDKGTFTGRLKKY